MAGLTGSEEVFNSAYTAAEREASIGNAKTKAAMLTAIGVSQPQIDGLAGAISASATNVLATIEDVPDDIEFGSTGGTACEGNDARLPTSDQKAALAGTTGTPSSSNPYVTDGDNRMVTGATTAVYLDCNRTDTYTADGTSDRPFKTLAESIAYLTAQGVAGVGYYATGTYDTGGGTFTLPDLPILVHGNLSTITGSSTFNIPGTYTAKNLNVVGNVNFTAGSGAHHATLEGQTITGSVGTESGVTAFLNRVTITGNFSKPAGSITYKSYDTIIQGNITGTGTIYTMTPASGTALTAGNVVITDENGALVSSTITAAALEYLEGLTGNVQDQLDAEVSARVAADLALLASQPTICAITYSGGLSAFAASAARVGWLDSGGADMIRVLLAGTGVGVLHDMDALRVEMLDPVDDYVRLQVSLTLDTGTLVMRTTSRPLPLVAWRRLGVRVDVPSGGELSSASVAVHIEGETYTLANGGLEVVGTAYTGAPEAGTGAWTLCAASDGSTALSARVASESWHALNYALSADDYALWLATGKLPHAGAGTMKDPDQPYVKVGGTGSISGASSTGFTVDAGAASMSAWKPTGYLSVMTGTLVTCNISLDAGVTAKVRLSDNFSMSNTVTLQEGSNTVVLTAAKTSAVARLAFVEMSSASGGTLSVSDFHVLGNTLAGLDLSVQPICARTAGGEVLLHSESGVEVVDAPERITLATQTDMTASGYLLGDRWVHPVGYIVDKVLVANKGSASATVTLRAGSSGGAVIATGTVAATGLPVALPISSLSALTATGGKIYVTGGASTSPLAITIKLIRG